MKTRVLLVDDHKMFRHALKLLLEQQQDLVVAGEAGNGHDLLKTVQETNPDVVCLDINMPILDGIEATRRLLAIKPEIKIIGLSASTDPYYIKELMRAGAAGYVTKMESEDEIIHAIRAVVRSKKKYLCPEVAAKVTSTSEAGNLFNQLNSRLSYREVQVLKLISTGHTSAQIAGLLHLSPATVEVHRRNIMGKLNLHSIAALTRYAIQHGISTQ